jgi:acetyltransferase-like isoleucine patch superfamily enzyme
MLPKTLRRGERAKLYFLPISILLSFWLAGILPVLLTKALLESLGYPLFWVLLPVILVFDYFLFMVFLLALFLLFRKAYPFIPDGVYSAKEYDYYKYGARHTYYRIYMDFLNPFDIVLGIPKIHKLFGAKIGEGCYLGSRLFDPDRTIIGKNCFLGQDSLVSAHIFQNSSLILSSVKLGDNVTIGGNSMVFPGVEIGKGAVVGAMTVIPQKMKIPPKTVWVCSKPRMLKRLKKPKKA